MDYKEKVIALLNSQELSKEQKEKLEEIFPELKESEDEKIRKELLQIANESEDSFYMVMTPNKRKRLIAWLEKLGGKKSKTPNENIIDCIGMCLTDADEQRFKNYNTNLKECLSWLEKQGGHAKFINGIQVGDKVTRNEDGVLVNLSQLNRVAKKDEKKGNQKPADKVEPKFKAGDWVVIDGITQQVTQIRPEGFDTDRAWNGKLTFKDVHLWTIQDAKDGDVLAFDNDIIVIFKDLYNAYTFHSYCYIQDRVFNTNEGSVPAWWKAEHFYPATKEQRDTLMKAMADAGYTFDFVKKELNKIEPKLVGWSEEDERMLEDTCRILSNSKECTTSNVRWLKSLRPKNKWKPSDKQMEVLWKYAEQNNYDGFILTSLHEQLKKLKG